MTSGLTVQIPRHRLPEHRWIVKTLLTACLGIPARVTEHGGPGIVISDGMSGRALELPSVLLSTDDPWSLSSAVPATVPEWITPADLGLTVPRPTVPVPLPFVDPQAGGPHAEGDVIRLPWDLFGSAFFMLSRLEEVVSDDADSHGRYPAASSLAVKKGFERIPVVNAWAEILWAYISHLWPSLERLHRRYQVLPSHDVDWPLVSDRLPAGPLLKSAVGDLVVRRSAGTAARRVLSGILPERQRPRINPGNTFDFLMQVSEQYGVQSAFYFIPENTAGSVDGTYTLDMPFIRDLFRKIHSQGHEIGIHPGYGTWRSADRIASGIAELKRLATECGIDQEAWGGRQHYLRWRAPETWQHWNAAGLAYDSTVGYAETVGFRAGACFDYTVFDVLERRELSLLERPLVVMEAALFGSTSPHNLAYPDQAGLAVVEDMADTVRAYGGNLTLLWHNSSLITRKQQRLYRAVIEALLHR